MYNKDNAEHVAVDKTGSNPPSEKVRKIHLISVPLKHFSRQSRKTKTFQSRKTKTLKYKKIKKTNLILDIVI